MPVAPDPRPGVVRTLCIIGFVLSALSMLSPLQLLASFAVVRGARGSATTSPAIAMQAPLFEPPLLGWTIASGVIAIALGVWLLWASLAAWRMRPSGRRALLAYAVTMLVWTPIVQVIYATLVVPRLVDAMSAAWPAGATGATRVSMLGGAVSGLVIALAYPICLVVFLRRPHVVAAYAAAGAGRASPRG